MSDRRSPHTDALDTLGTIHRFEERRDAIHIAVQQVTAAHAMPPGTNIKYEVGPDGKPVHHTVVACARHEALGIVDPYLVEPVSRGDEFWMLLMPGSVRSLRHAWEHPDIPEVPTSSVQPEQDHGQLILSNNVTPTGPDWSKYPQLVNLAEELELSNSGLVSRFAEAAESNDYYVGGSEAEGVWGCSDVWDDMERYARDHDQHLLRIINECRSRGEFGRHWVSCSC